MWWLSLMMILKMIGDMKEPLSIKDIIENRKRAGLLAPPDERIRVQIPNARQVLMYGIVHFCGEQAQWLPEYEEVAEWLSDNQGKGILCLGQPGRGKTLITQRILPVIFERCLHKMINCYIALDLNGYDVDERKKTHYRYDEIRKWKIIAIDDIGTEPQACIFGETHDYFSELVDCAEQKQKMLILSTNLNRQKFIDRYGMRTFDRLTAITRRVVFKGKSLRE